MKNILLKSGAILTILFIAVGLNGYLYIERQAAESNLSVLLTSIKQKQTLIKLANNKPEATSSIRHRLALASNRISVGDDFQQLSKTLQLQRLDFQISPETIVQTPAVQEALTESTVELKFTNTSDQPLFQMMKHILEDFPGLVYPKEIVMWRDDQEAAPLIHGRFKFEWLKSNEKDEA